MHFCSGIYGYAIHKEHGLQPLHKVVKQELERKASTPKRYPWEK